MSASLHSCELEPAPERLEHDAAAEHEIIWLDDKIDRTTRDRIEQSRVAQRRMVVATGAVEAEERLESGAVDGVLVNLRDVDESVRFLQQVAARQPFVRRFLCAAPQETTPLIAAHNSIIPRGWHQPVIDDAVSRGFAISQWEANPSLVSVFSYIRNIPTLPTVYTQITEALQRDDCSAEEIGRLISREPAITAKLLQCVNSGAAGLSRRISSPREAVMFFGTARVRSLVLLSSLFVKFDGSRCASFSTENFFKKNLEIAGWSSSITMGETQDKKMADLSFTAGLLHGFGILLLAANLPESYDQVLRTAAERRVGVERIELETYGATHCDVGGFILGKWGIPFPIISAVAWHSVPYRCHHTEFTPLCAVHIAKAVEGYVRTGELAYDRIYAERLGLSADKIQNWARRLMGESLYW